MAPCRGGERPTPSAVLQDAPGHLAWGPDYLESRKLTLLLTERQRRLIQKPAIYRHDPVI